MWKLGLFDAPNDGSYEPRIRTEKIRKSGKLLMMVEGRKIEWSGRQKMVEGRKIE